MHKLRFLLKESFQLESNISIDEGCGFGESHWKFVNEFANYCKQNLGLPDVPSIKIVDNRQGGMTTGAYDPQTHGILILGKGRALVDVLRTLAHELTHYRQRLKNQIKSDKRDWNIEGEADAEAGKMVFTFAHSDPSRLGIYEI